MNVEAVLYFTRNAAFCLVVFGTTIESSLGFYWVQCMSKSNLYQMSSTNTLSSLNLRFSTVVSNITPEYPTIAIRSHKSKKYKMTMLKSSSTRVLCLYWYHQTVCLARCTFCANCQALLMINSIENSQNPNSQYFSLLIEICFLVFSKTNSK